jgi:hypothetical protein
LQKSPTSHNRIVYASPLKRLGFRSARSFRFAPFPRLTPAQFASPANLWFAYSGWQTVVYNRNVIWKYSNKIKRTRKYLECKIQNLFHCQAKHTQPAFSFLVSSMNLFINLLEYLLYVYNMICLIRQMNRNSFFSKRNMPVFSDKKYQKICSKIYPIIYLLVCPWQDW